MEQLETLPSPDVDLDQVELKASQLKQKTVAHMDKLVNSYKTILSEKRKRVLGLKDDIKEKEQEVDNLKQDIKRYESVRSDIKELEEQTKDMEAKLATMRKDQELAKQRMADHEKASAILKKRIDICRKSTGLVYSFIRENCLKFDFTLIDKHQPDKVFTFTLDMTDDGLYKVEGCDPMIPNIDTLTKNLNKDYDVNIFVKLIRREFCALASSSEPASSAILPLATSPPPATSPQPVASPHPATSPQPAASPQPAVSSQPASSPSTS